jgi:hypothetical protein
LSLGNVPQSPQQSEVYRREEETSSRRGDEGCPDESPSVDDATGYSKEEEEALEEEAPEEEVLFEEVAASRH